ncbi:MAG: hypothetical protein JSR36_10000 [Proteobacteria bacterium]|nr:hypothetical protein [Pseudomonadota bacterium]
MDASVQSARSSRITVADLAQRSRERPRIFLAVFILTIAAFVTYTIVAKPQYRSVVKLMPREPDTPTGGLQSVLGQLGGLASLAGLSFGSVNEQEAIALLKSRALYMRFAAQKNLLPLLFSSKWDSATQRWRTDAKHTPTIEDGWLMFDKLRRVTDDPKTQLITLDVTWKNRQQAAEWANELVQLANETLRQRALQESAASIASYQDQLAHTDVVELRQAINKLMEIQLNRSAVARSRLDYALTVIDPAVVSDEKHYVSPRRFLALVIAGPLALFFAVLAVLAADSLHRVLAAVRGSR